MLKITPMSKNIILCFLVLFSLKSYGQLTQHTINVNGSTRDYYRYLPSNYQITENLPVVIVLHGLGGTAQQMTQAGFNLIADTARIIVLYPDAKNNGFGQSAWNNGTGLSSTADDIGFMNLLMDKMILEQNANSAEIYVTGFSMGGIMSHHLACALNHRIAAIGSMAGTMATSDIQNCVPSYATPVIHLHGTSDGTVPYDSNPLPTLSLVPETMEFWRNVHACNATADSTRIPDIASDNITIDRFVYQACNPMGSVELWRFNGADHIYLYKPVNDITEGVEVWLFLRKWQHPNPATATMADLGKNALFAWYPNPSNGTINIVSENETTLRVYNLAGALVKEIEVNKGKQKIHLGLPAGTYYVQKDGFSKQIQITSSTGSSSFGK